MSYGPPSIERGLHQTCKEPGDVSDPRLFSKEEKKSCFDSSFTLYTTGDLAA
jgi:hypothetical protein